MVEEEEEEETIITRLRMGEGCCGDEVVMMKVVEEVTTGLLSCQHCFEFEVEVKMFTGLLIDFV